VRVCGIHTILQTLSESNANLFVQSLNNFSRNRADSGNLTQPYDHSNCTVTFLISWYLTLHTVKKQQTQFCRKKFKDFQITFPELFWRCFTKLS